MVCYAARISFLGETVVWIGVLCRISDGSTSLLRHLVINCLTMSSGQQQQKAK